MAHRTGLSYHDDHQIATAYIAKLRYQLLYVNPLFVRCVSAYWAGLVHSAYRPRRRYIARTYIASDADAALARYHPRQTAANDKSEVSLNGNNNGGYNTL